MCEGAGRGASEGGVGRRGSGAAGAGGLGAGRAGRGPHPAPCRAVPPERARGHEGESGGEAPGLWAGQEDRPGTKAGEEQRCPSGGTGPC